MWCFIISLYRMWQTTICVAMIKKVLVVVSFWPTLCRNCYLDHFWSDDCASWVNSWGPKPSILTLNGLVKIALVIVILMQRSRHVCPWKVGNDAFWRPFLHKYTADCWISWINIHPDPWLGLKHRVNCVGKWCCVWPADTTMVVLCTTCTFFLLVHFGQRTCNYQMTALGYWIRNGPINS